MWVKTYSATGRLWALGTFKRKVISVSQSSAKFHCGLTFNSQLFMLSWQIQTLIFPCSRLGGGVWMLLSESFPPSPMASQATSHTRNCGCGGSRGCGWGSQTQGEATTSSTPHIQWEGKDYAYCTNLLISFCKDNLDFWLKLFSNSTQDAIKQGRTHKQMSANRDSYYQHITQHVFTNDWDSVVQDAYQTDPLPFVKTIKGQFAKWVSLISLNWEWYHVPHLISTFRLKTKYNMFNKGLGSQVWA